jgi:DNA-binding FrmR family transcriptional regulator
MDNTMPRGQGNRIGAAPKPPRAAQVQAPLRRPIENHTGWGYMKRMRDDIKTSCAKRLSRIEGQVRGIARMLDEDRYCIDVVTQISAVRAALRRLEEEILRDHVAHCVEHAIASGNKAEQRRKIEELMEVVSRAER